MNKVSTRASKALLCSALFSLCLVPTGLFAQEATGAQMIEEVVVTARKIEESVRDVPATVNALTEAALDERGINSLQEVADATPGFDFAHAFGRNDFRPVIRGQSNILGRANAGLFVDGIIIEEGNASIPMAALQRVEVVKGPQSALYGRSTLAGAINYVLKEPGESFDAEASVDIGERDYSRIEAHASGPLTDTAGFAVTVSRYQRGGEYNNSSPGNALGTVAYEDEVGDEETTSFTGVLTLNPSDQLSVRLHSIFEETDDAHYAIGLLPSSMNNCYQVTRGGSLMQPAPPAGTPEALSGSVNLAGYNGSGYYCGEVDVDTVLENNGGGDNTSLETGFYPHSGTDRESFRLGLRLDWDVSDSMTLTSMTGYNNVETQAEQDQTFGGGDTRRPVAGVGSPFAVQGFGPTPPIIHTRVGFLTSDDDEFEDFSQEFRVSGEMGTNIRYLAGVYYYESEESGDAVGSGDTRATTWIDGTTRAFNPFNPRFVPLSGFSTSATYEGAMREDDGGNELASFSVFGSVEVDVSDRLSVGAEIRYNEDEFDIRPEGESEFVNGTFDAFLPKVTVGYKLVDDVLLYGNVAVGNKPGSLNSAAGVPAADREVDEETAVSYEIGIKSLWMDGRVEANVALYQIDWEDMQLTSTRAANVNGQDRTFSILENVGEASITGIELDVSVLLTDFWDARIAYAWTDSEIEEFVQSVDACPLEADGDRASCTPSSFREAALIAGYSASGDVIISGKQLPQTSEHQASLSTRFHGQVSADWGWFVRADWNYNSKRYAQVYNLAHTGDREILNLRAGVEGERMSFTAWVDNALDDNASPALIRYVQANDLTFNPFNRAIGATMPEQRRAGVTARFSL